MSFKIFVFYFLFADCSQDLSSEIKIIDLQSQRIFIYILPLNSREEITKDRNLFKK